MDYRHFLRVVVALFAIPTLNVVGQTIPAFSGADGAAANVTGGRANANGGIVYHVTKLGNNNIVRNITMASG